MKFGQTLEREKIQEWRFHYLNYGALTNYIEDPDHSPEEDRFMNMVNQELQKVNFFTAGKVAETVNSLRGTQESLLQGNREDMSVVRELGSEIATLDKYVHQNIEGFRKILKKFKKQTGHSVLWFTGNQSANKLHQASNIIHELVVQLSQVGQSIQRADDTGSTRSGGDGGQDVSWVPPQTFERVTTKYWVRQEDITALKVYVLQHVPILEMSPSKPVDLEYYNQDLEQTHNYISSVYLDSPGLNCYHERIEQREGAQLFRVRWYGGERAANGSRSVVPAKDTEYVFVERKTHHESWAVEKSTKERFMLKRSEIVAFMDGSLDVAESLQTMVKEGKLKAASLGKTQALAEECQKAVQARRLAPKIRTCYHRTAFQQAKSNTVRLSLDNPLLLFRERFCALEKESLAAFWSNLQGPETLHPFEFAVLEVKLSGEAPLWVDDLLAKDWLIPVPKFSKFQHSIAAHFPDQIKTVPYWIAQDDVSSDGADDAGSGRMPPSKIPTATNSTLPGMTAPTVSSTSLVRKGNAGAGAGAATHPHVVTPLAMCAGSVSAASVGVAVRKGQVVGLKDAVTAAPAEMRRRHDGDAGALDSLRRGHQVADDAQHMAALRQATGNPRGQAQAAGTSPAAPASPAARLGGRRGTIWRPARGQSTPADEAPTQATPKVKKTNLVRAKIEPKTFFANERTFIQWLGASLLLVTLSSAIMSVNDTGRIVGTIMWPVAMAFIFYALGVFHWRLKKLKARDGRGFDDPYGPTILSVILAGAMVAILVTVWTRDFEVEESRFTPSERRQRRQAAGADPCAELDAAAQVCSAAGAALAVVNQTTLTRSLAWPAACLDSRWTSEAAVSEIEGLVADLGSRESRWGTCVDVDVARDDWKQVFHERNELRSCIGNEPNCGSSASLRSVASADGTATTLPCASARSSIPPVGRQWTIGCESAIEMCRYFAPGPAMGASASKRSALAHLAAGKQAAPASEHFTTTTTFGFALGGQPAQLHVSRQHRTTSDRARSKAPTAVTIELEQRTPTLTSAQHGAWLFQMLRALRDHRRVQCHGDGLPEMQRS